MEGSATSPQEMAAQAQQAQTMLSQLPQEQQKQIEQAVNEYRKQLLDRGFTNTNDVQSFVWTYYTQLVQQLYQEFVKSQCQGESQQASASSAMDASTAQDGQAQPQLNQWAQMQQQAQQLQQQRMQMQQQQLQGWMRPGRPNMPNMGMKGGLARPGMVNPGWGSMVGGEDGWDTSSSGCGAVGSSAGADADGSGAGGQADGMSSGMSGGMAMGGMAMGASVKAGAKAGVNPVFLARLNQGNGASAEGWNMKGGAGAGVQFQIKGCGKGPMGKGGWQMQQGKGMMGGKPGMMMGGMDSSKGGMDGCKGGCKGGMDGCGMGGCMGGCKGGCKGGMAGCGQMGARPTGKGGPSKAGPQFPPALQRWLQRLFASQTQSGETDQALQKETHKYLRHWVQQWVKTGELWHRNWEVATLPTPDEIRANLPPGSLSGQGAGPVLAGCKGKGKPGFTPPSAKAKGGSPPRGFSGGFDGDRRRRRSRSRSRSRSGRKRSRSRRDRRRRRSSSRSCSRRGSRSRSRSPEGQGWGKGKGKDGKGKNSFEETRQRVQLFLNQKLASKDYRGNTKELMADLQRSMSVNEKRFRGLFNMTINQYAQTFYSGGSRGAMLRSTSGLSDYEQDMRAARADRFKSHLEAEKAPVAMVSFNDGEAVVNGGPIIGELDEMCSRHEAKERETTRQLDKFEWKQGTDPKHPEVNLALATRKYQRSSADKAYRSSETRTLNSLWKTMEYLMTQILDFDVEPKPGYAVQKVPYIECYSYLRDRTRAIRVELHLQQPRSTTTRTFIEAHESCLRFEMLTLYLLTGCGGPSGSSTEKYDPKLGLKAISQTIEPLLNGYQAVKAKLLAKSILAEAMGGFDMDEGDGDDQEYCSNYEMAVHRYIILLLMSFSPEGLGAHIAKLDREILSHPLVSFATEAYAAFQTEDYARFLHFYRQADFLTAVAMSGIADLARLRALFMLFRTYPQPVGDKVALRRIKTMLAFATDAHTRQFLSHHGVRIEEGKDGPYMVLPKKGTPEATNHQLLSGPNRLPEKCEFPKGFDSLLESKYTSLEISRRDIVFGAADPEAPPPPPAPAAPEVADPQAVASDDVCMPDQAPDAGAVPDALAPAGGPDAVPGATADAAPGEAPAAAPEAAAAEAPAAAAAEPPAAAEGSAKEADSSNAAPPAQSAPEVNVIPGVIG